MIKSLIAKTKSISNTDTNTRTKLIYVFVVLVLIFQLSIPYFLHLNEKEILENGTVFKLKVDKLVVDFIDEKATLEFSTLQNQESKMGEINKLNYEINESQGFYYNVAQNEYKSAILVDTDLNRRKETAFLQTTTGIKNHFAKPDFYIKGDKLKTVYTGIANGLGYINIEADVVVYKGGYIVNQVYINRTPYEEFIEDNYFDLLDIEGL